MTEPPSPPPEPNPYQPADPAQPYSAPGQYPQPGQYPPPAAQPPAYGQAPYAAPYGQAQPAAAASTSNDAVVALVLALCAWFFCPLVLAVVALVFAGKAKRAIDASNGWVTGAGMVTAARVIAWINIALTLVALVFIVIVLIAAAVSSNGSVTVN